MELLKFLKEAKLTLLFALFAIAAALTSLSTLLYLFQRHIDGRPLLPYEPRRRVPWTGVAPLALLGLMLFHSVAGYLAEPVGAELIEQLPVSVARTAAAVAPAPQAAPLSVSLSAACGAALHEIELSKFVEGVWFGALVNLSLAMVLHAGLAAFCGAARGDLGWPSSGRQLLADIRVGAAACAAALLPVYAIQLTLVTVFEPETTHPLIESYAKNPSLKMALAVGVSAVFAAPLFEETSFRVVLQGWLEKLSVAASSLAAMQQREATTFAAHIKDSATDDQTSSVASASAESTESTASPALQPPERVRLRSESADQRVHRRPGWGPIVTSGLLFGLAHWGHGVAPASLVLLGLVLGYLYQRTHRIVPCIVCHALFNAFSLALLGLQVSALAE